MLYWNVFQTQKILIALLLAYVNDFAIFFSKDLIISVVTARDHEVDGDFCNQLATFDNHTKTFQISN